MKHIYSKTMVYLKQSHETPSILNPEEIVNSEEDIGELER